jgi:choline-sulfatase
LIRKYHKFTGMKESENAQMLQKVRQTYLAMVSYTDSLLGKLLDTVDHSYLKDNTAILAFSDHGDYAGDYGLVEKWPSGLEDALTQVPLIARIPQVTDHAKGSTWKEPVQLFDIMPTVMEVSGIQVPHTHFAKSLVKPMMGTADPAVDGRKYVYAEGGFASFEPRDLESDCDATNKPCVPLGTNYYPKLLQQQERPDSVARAIMVRSKTHKLIWRNDPEYGEKDCELYDLVKDPKELENQWDVPAYAGVKAELKDQLLHWLSQTSDVTPFHKDPRDSYPGVIETSDKVYAKTGTLPLKKPAQPEGVKKVPQNIQGVKKIKTGAQKKNLKFNQKTQPQQGVRMPYWR